MTYFLIEQAESTTLAPLYWCGFQKHPKQAKGGHVWLTMKSHGVRFSRRIDAERAGVGTTERDFRGIRITEHPDAE